MERRALVAMLSLGVAVILSGGCQSSEPPKVEGVESHGQRGPLKLDVRATPNKIMLGDLVHVEMRMQTPKGYRVQFADVDGLEGGEARDIDDEDPQPTPDGNLEWQRTLTIEPWYSGNFEIPPLVVRYARPDDNGAGEFENELASDSMKIEVRSVLTTQDAVTSPRDITGTLEPRIEKSPWKIATLVAIAVLLLAALIFAIIAYRRRAKHVPPVLPEVWALRELAALNIDAWLAEGRAREFYYRISEVVRGYVERQFGLAAPDMTTEEFLETLLRNRRAIPYDTHKLGEFLQKCDMVKYAAVSPQRPDAEDAVGAARSFVDATAASVRAAARETAQQTGAASEAESEDKRE
jgi:hypothetical protein